MERQDQERVAQLEKQVFNLYEQGRYQEAIPLAHKVLLIHEKSLGPEHPHVAGCLYNLARLHQDQGNSAEALPLFQRSLSIQEKTLGSEHLGVATCLRLTGCKLVSLRASQPTTLNPQNFGSPVQLSAYGSETKPVWEISSIERQGIRGIFHWREQLNYPSDAPFSIRASFIVRSQDCVIRANKGYQLSPSKLLIIKEGAG